MFNHHSRDFARFRCVPVLIRGDHRCARGLAVAPYCARIVTFPNSALSRATVGNGPSSRGYEFFTPYVRESSKSAASVGRSRSFRSSTLKWRLYRGDVLVEHDVTFDLYQQIDASRAVALLRTGIWCGGNGLRRPRSDEFPAVVAMSAKDAELLGGSNVHVIPNGVDLDRFRPAA